MKALLVLTVFAASVLALPATPDLDPGLKTYQRVPGISGNLSAIGSDTLNNMMTHWAEGFRSLYPNVRIQIEGKGSSTAPPALIEGTAQLGPMSREMRASEIDAFVDEFGYEPTPVYVGIDAVAVYVHKDNPLPGLSLQELDRVFSSTRKRGGSDLTRWSGVGLGGALGDRSINVYGRNSASGTYGFFKKVVLLDGDYRASVNEQPGSSAVVQSVATDLFGIGYSGIGYRTSGVRILALSNEGGDLLYYPTFDNALNGNYPLARFLMVYVNKPPNARLDPLTLEFLKFVLSRQGQQVVVDDRYFPLPAKVVQQQLAALSQ
ncbi:MAG: PstS family phosphate ABC transporter substrate-binding protein [Opitutales bacterium]